MGWKYVDKEVWEDGDREFWLLDDTHKTESYMVGNTSFPGLKLEVAMIANV
jgi:hypothetical protein